MGAVCPIRLGASSMKLSGTGVGTVEKKLQLVRTKPHATLTMHQDPVTSMCSMVLIIRQAPLTACIHAPMEVPLMAKSGKYTKVLNGCVAICKKVSTAKGYLFGFSAEDPCPQHANHAGELLTAFYMT